jgi:hypothetical protein
MQQPPSATRVFISHAGRDTAWAEWIAWHLRQAGFATELDVFDWQVGDSFVLRMNEALERPDLVVLSLWSTAYFEAERFTTIEWSAVLASRSEDVPRLVPLRIEDVRPPAILRGLIFRDSLD